jgi:hypothetical protein
MSEGLFILTTLIVAYVIYVIVNEKKKGDTSKNSTVAAAQGAKQATVSEKPKAAMPKPAAKSATAKPAAVAKPAAKPVAAPKPAAKSAVAKPATVAKPVAKSVAAAKPIAAPTATPVTEATAVKGTGLKDPKTGEVATTYSNYRFTKRWIKEALVAEKFLDKVYKNDELNASVEAKIKDGIIKLEAMKKYKP